jgi:hypothetical protein
MRAFLKSCCIGIELNTALWTDSPSQLNPTETEYLARTETPDPLFSQAQIDDLYSVC